MVDTERLRRILQSVSDDLSILDGYTDAENLVGDAAGLDRVKYRFVTAIEGCIDAAQHVCSAQGWGPPETNGDAMRVLGRHEVFGDDLADTMVRAVGFRNILVHGYARVDDQLVVDQLERLADLRRYVAAVASLADRRPRDEA